MTPLLEIIMRFIASLPAGPQTWLLNSPLAPHLDAFAAHLADGGYSAQTTVCGQLTAPLHEAAV